MNIFEPNRIRCTLWFLLYYAVAWFFLYLGFKIFAGYEFNLALVLLSSLGVFVVVLVGIFVIPARTTKLLSITVLDEIITGPSLWVNRPVRFNLSTLDTKKSRQRSVFQRIFGYRLIVSTTGKKILLVERVFDKDQVTEIFKTIGCADSLAA